MADRPRKGSEMDEDRFVPDDVAEMNRVFARVIGEHERIGEGFREAERRAVFDWAEECDDWFGGQYY